MKITKNDYTILENCLYYFIDKYFENITKKLYK